MRIYHAENYESMCRQGANIISAQLIMKPNSVLGLATGSTPIGIYKQLIDWYQKGDLSFSEASTVNLDEYVGLAPEHPQSYRYFMEHNLFQHVDVKFESTHVPFGLAKDAEKECKRYNSVIKHLGGIDLQLLGMGHNGHIGFNEPGQAFERETHRVTLAEETIRANTRFFEDESQVPRHAFTMGMKSIMWARKILVVVSGEDKAEIVRKAFAGKVTPEVPASILQLHPDVTLVGDTAALQLLLAEEGMG